MFPHFRGNILFLYLSHLSNKKLSQTGESINKAQTKETILNSYSEQPPLHKVYVKYILFIKMEHPIHQLPFSAEEAPGSAC